ncbi:hypothetical protein [Amphritea sp. HPY]|uniref:hypothetical protein n=1 Tax=Amphritea sp. HPY TaxID=3421652 RepID=UPI003D7D62A4
MNQLTPPIASAATLIKACISAISLAAVVLTVAILPAEYNIDPTGLGKAMGLTSLASVEPIKSAVTAAKVSYQSDTVSIEVPPMSGLEYKLHLQKNAKLKYQWSSGSGSRSAPIYFDFHGEPQGDKTGYFESFTISTSNEISGTLTAPFDGSHGWYWKNTSSEPITISLNIEGAYQIEGIK